MPPSSSILSYRDVQAALDRALSNGRGVKIACETLGDAQNLRQRCYNFRKLDRRENMKTYAEDAPLYAKSVYDVLTICPAQEEDGSICLVIEVASAERLKERLTDL